MKLLIIIACILSFLFLAACREDEPTEEEPPVTTIPRIIEKEDVEMVLIPAGEFEMGSNDGRFDEKPVHTVYIDAFYIDTHEVTVGQYKQFIKETDYRPLPDWVSIYSPTDKHPVFGVSWHDAMAYCQWAGKRLPTEAEWEYAARGGLERKKYPWGDKEPDETLANFNGNVGDTTSVGKYPPNGYGLYDMAGNVWEWCMDEYDSGFYSGSPRANPVEGGLISFVDNLYKNISARRVLRGGSWYDFNYSVRVAVRYWYDPDYKNNYLGFRCVSARSVN